MEARAHCKAALSSAHGRLRRAECPEAHQAICLTSKNDQPLPARPAKLRVPRLVVAPHSRNSCAVLLGHAWPRPAVATEQRAWRRSTALRLSAWRRKEQEPGGALTFCFRRRGGGHAVSAKQPFHEGPSCASSACHRTSTLAFPKKANSACAA